MQAAHHSHLESILNRERGQQRRTLLYVACVVLISVIGALAL